MSEVVELTSELIRLDSQTPVSNAALAEFIAGLVGPFASEVEPIEYTDSGGQRKVSLVARIGEGEGGLALSAHLDTVPGVDWTADPFDPRVVGDRLYGLGACDMKGPLACVLLAARTYPDLNAGKPLTLLLSTDEETDTEGARRIAGESSILASVRPEHCVIAEPTGLQVAYSHKAAITFTAEAEGRAAHSSTGEGVNANLKMIPFLHDMRRLYEELTSEEEYWDPDFQPPYPDWNIVISNFDTAPNVTVPRSRCTVNFRYTPRLDPDPIVSRVEESARNSGVELSYWSSGDPLFTPPDSPLVRLALEAAGRKAPITVPYRTDACILASMLPCVVVGPGGHRQAHTVNEWVGIDQLHRAVGIYETLIRRACGAIAF